MFKHVLLLTTSFLLILLPAGFLAANAEETDPTEDLLAPSCIVVDQNDPSVVLYEKDADDQRIPGSTMKIMTCILTLELCDDLDQEVTVTAQAAALKSSNSLLEVIKGENLSVRELLYGLMLESGNDAALLLAQTVAGSVESFAELMNEKAASLGMTNTHFINSSGAYKRDQYSTARDMAVLTCYAMQNEEFRTIVSTVTYTIEPNNVRRHSLEIENSNKLISDPVGSTLYYEYATGVKTGSTEQGGKCLVASASMDGASVVGVFLGAVEGGSKLARMTQVYKDAKYLLDLALTTRYVSVSAADLGLSYQCDAPVSFAETDEVPLTASFGEETVRIADTQAEAIRSSPDAVTMEADLPSLTAPISAGDVCGTVVCSFDGQELFSADLIAETDVPAKQMATFLSATPVPEPAAKSGSAGFFGIVPWWAYVSAGTLAAGIALFFVLRAVKRKKQPVS